MFFISSLKVFNLFWVLWTSRVLSFFSLLRFEINKKEKKLLEMVVRSSVLEYPSNLHLFDPYHNT